MTAMIDPRELKASERKALEIIGGPHKLFRGPGGWGHVPNRVSLNMAIKLRQQGLARIEANGRNPQLVMTGVGNAALTVMQSRRERRTA